MKYSIVLILLAVSFNTLCQGVIFHDDFDDNRNNWPLSADEDGYSRIQNGKLIINDGPESGTNWINTGIFFDPDEDFEVEFSMTHVQGEENTTTGLVFGIADASNFFNFSITATQYFKYEKCLAGEYVNIVPWTSLPSVIRPSGQSNKLLLSKKGETIKLYVNDKYVSKQSFEPFFGQKFGFWVQENTVEIDYLTIRSGNSSTQQTAQVQNNVQSQQTTTTASFYSDVDQNIPISRSRNDDAIAVVIGNTDYLKAKKVDFAVNDSRSIKNYLVKTFGFLEGNILHVENATKGDFELMFGVKGNHHGKLANTIREGISDVFVFYSGHGAPGLNNKQGYFVPVECDPNYVELSGYPTEVFYENLSILGAKSVTVVLDACFSGATVFENISPLVIKAKPEHINSDIMVLSSSSGSEVSSWYNDQSHGMFTYFFLKAFQDKHKTDLNKDNKLSLAEVYKSISDNNYGVPYWSRRIHGIEQHPTLSGTQQDMILVEF